MRRKSAYGIVKVTRRAVPFAAIANSANLGWPVDVGSGLYGAKDVFAGNDRLLLVVLVHGAKILVVFSDSRERIERLGPRRLGWLRLGRPDGWLSGSVVHYDAAREKWLGDVDNDGNDEGKDCW